MLIYVILFWILTNMSAPAWVFIVFGIAVTVKCFVLIVDFLSK